MHMRKKKWARPELAACPFYTNGGEEYRNAWRTRFAAPDHPLHLEMGCGKAVSTAKMIADNPGVNYVAADLSADVLGVARRNIVAACGEEPGNVQILLADICFVDKLFGPEDAPERIYIHFCNPWTEHPKHAKRRLTHPRQLMQYRTILRPDGEIWFKTDDEELFNESLVYFPAAGFEIIEMTRDLHAEQTHKNYVSEHEKMFAARGMKIKALIARKTVLPAEKETFMND